MAVLLSESEHGHAHHHATGIRWLDLVVALCAIFLSLISLVVSIEHGRTMEEMVRENKRMVAGSTMPFLTFGGSQLDPVTNRPHLRLILTNGGVGPARIDWFQLHYKGVSYTPTAIDELIRACCLAAVPKGGLHGYAVLYANISGTMIPQRESVDVIDVRPGAGPKFIDALDSAREDITAHACYCSVLDECWKADFTSKSFNQQVRVDKCDSPSSGTLW